MRCQIGSTDNSSSVPHSSLVVHKCICSTQTLHDNHEVFNIPQSGIPPHNQPGVGLFMEQTKLGLWVVRMMVVVVMVGFRELAQKEVQFLVELQP